MSYYMKNKKMAYKKTGYKKAFAFSITMWIIASLLFATVVILRFAKDEVGVSKGLNDKLQTQLIAQSVLESLKFYVPTADYTLNSLKNQLLNNIPYPLPSEIIVDGREYNLTSKITISLRDTSSMINVMYGSSDIIAKALSSQKNDELSYVLKNSLDDWRDEDNVPKVNGAEQSTYQSLGQKVRVRNNAAIQDIHELKLIHGFKEVDFDTIESNLYYGRGTGLNLMLINNKRYLATLLGSDEEFIGKMLELRKTEPSKFRKTISTLPNYNDDYMSFWLSKQFYIQIKVQQGEARTILNTMISFKQINERPYVAISSIMY